MKLDDKQKVWLVSAYATFKRTGEVRAEFAETFGVEIPENQARGFNLTIFRNEEEAAKRNKGRWWSTHVDARRRFDESVNDIPIASKAYRVRKLDEMFDLAYQRRNFKTAADLLEQAAKETGDAYSNRRIVGGQVDVEHSGTVEVDVPEDVRDLTLAEHLRGAIAQALSNASKAQAETIQ